MSYQQPIRAVEAEEEPKSTLRSLEPLGNALAFESVKRVLAAHVLQDEDVVQIVKKM